jgi:hypothetical protein
MTMITVILRIKDDRSEGLRGTVELPGGTSKTFSSDEDLLDTIYEWAESALSGNGSGSTSSSAIRVT